MEYDIILKNGRIVDAVNDVNEICDLGIKEGRIVKVAKDININKTKQHFNLSGKIVIPGIIDTHVHVSEWLGGCFGHKMLALAGVTTAIDFSGPIESVLEMARDYGNGINLACINYIRPGHTVENENPSSKELEKLLINSLKQGAIGYKLLGGHYPLTPEATAYAIDIANKHKAYVAFHVGTLNSGSNLEGLKEAVKLAEDNKLHIAHINSYCRGQVDEPQLESLKALELLKESSNIVSESYLSPLNGTSAICNDGLPESRVTCTCLEMGGFPPTEKGLSDAIREGWALINIKSGGINTVTSGEEGVKHWLGQGKSGTVSFPVNPGISRYILAVGKDKKGKFIIDALSTDGGGIPRNTIVENGLLLVKWGALTLKDFIIKSSSNPAKILGLKDKGHLGEGADADITVIDWERDKAYMTIVSGEIVMYDGLVVGKGTTFITTDIGAETVKSYGLKPLVIHLSESSFYNGYKSN